MRGISFFSNLLSLIIEKITRFNSAVRLAQKTHYSFEVERKNNNLFIKKYYFGQSKLEPIAQFVQSQEIQHLKKEELIYLAQQLTQQTQKPKVRYKLEYDQPRDIFIVYDLATDEEMGIMRSEEIFAHFHILSQLSEESFDLLIFKNTTNQFAEPLNFAHA